jgi:ankyrin repeat protein
VELVLAHGVAVDRLGTSHPVFLGHRAYELASMYGYSEIAELLLQASAAPLDDVHQLLAAAMNGERTEVARLTIAEPSLAGRALARNPYLPIQAAGLGWVAALRLQVDLGFDVNVMGHNAPLHEAAFRGQLDAVKELIRLGADPALRDPTYNGTPQNWAEHNNQQEVLDYLARL